jgi:hypothetical protein
MQESSLPEHPATAAIRPERAPSAAHLERAEAILGKPVPDAPRRHPIAEAVESEAMSIYHPGGGNTHAPEWVPDPRTGRTYLGVSMLVKETAADYATRIMLQREDVDESQGYWARRGNLAAWDHTRRITPFRECRVSLPLDNYHRALAGVDIVGHIDALRVSLENGHNVSFNVPSGVALLTTGHNLFLTPIECKLFESATDVKVDLAGRQGVAYNAILHRLLELMLLSKCGTVSKAEIDWLVGAGHVGGQSGYILPLADFHDAEQDPHAMPLELGDLLGHAKVFGASVHIDQGNEGKGFVQFIDDEQGDGSSLSDNVWEWLVSKARAIMVSVAIYRGFVANREGKSYLCDRVGCKGWPETEGHSDCQGMPTLVDAALGAPGGVMDYLKSPLGLQEFRTDLTAMEAHVDADSLLFHALSYERARLAAKSFEDDKDLHAAKACSIIFEGRDAQGNVLKDPKTGERLRTLRCSAGPGLDVKVTAVPYSGGKTHTPKVTLLGDGWKSPGRLGEVLSSIESLREAVAAAPEATP